MATAEAEEPAEGGAAAVTWRIHDLGSFNGTSVNGVPLAAGVEHALADGDVVRLGRTQSDVAYRFVAA